MKEKLTRNIGVKILSVVLAILLWLVITNMNDPVLYRDFHDVPVLIKNENLIKNPRQSYEIIEGEMVDFKVKARRSIIENLSKSDFEVVADFAHLSNVNSVSISITPKRYKDEIEIIDKGDIQHMIVSIEKLSSKQFQLNIVTKGEVEEGYYLGPKSAVPVMIEITGPESRLDKIKKVIVEVDVNGASKSFKRLAQPILLDEEGNEIENTRLALSDNRFEVDIVIYQVKEIGLKVTTTGQPANGYVMTGIEYQPKTIEIAAKDSILKNIDSLEVPRDITNATDNIEEFIELQEWLDEGVYLVESDATASVKITIEKLETKEISIWPNDIELKNKSDSLEVIYITKGPIKVNVLGPPSELSQINRNTLKPYINLLGYSQGTYNLDIETDKFKHASIDDKPEVILNLISY